MESQNPAPDGPPAPPPTGAPRPGPPLAAPSTNFPPPAPAPPAFPPPVVRPPLGAAPPAGFPRPVAAPRRPRVGLILGLVGGAIAVLVLVLVIVIAGAVSAQVARQDALAEHGTAEDQLALALERAESEIAEADEVLALAENPALPSAEIAALSDLRTTTAALVADADAALAVDVADLPAEEVRDATTVLRTFTTDLTRADLPAAFDRVLAAAEAGAADVEAAAFDAENAPRIAFRAARDGLALASDDQVGESLVAYADAAAAIAASHAEELAEKTGPLFDARMAVQEFARSMSGGVMLEFDWAPTVNGYGMGGSYGGTSYWTTADGGQATITLSDSVASLWPGAGVQALVVHEVGHAVLARQDCHVLFFESDLYAGEEESWATAWAIGQGYTADGSGESIYGRPSDALISLSQQCR